MNDQIIFLNAITTASPGTVMSFAGAKGASIQLWSAAGSSSTVLIQGSENGTVWATLATITDVALVGASWFGSAQPFIRVNPTVVGSGTISAIGHALDSDPGPWHQYAGASTTPIALTSVAMTVANLTDSGLTDTRVPYASTAGLLVDAAAFNYTTASGKLAATIFKGGAQDTVAAGTTNGAVAVAPKTVVITKAGVLAMTLVAPTSTTHDGYIMRFVAANANAHTLTTDAAAINGDKNVATWGGALGDSLTLIAYQGKWYTLSAVNITLSGS